MVRIRLRREGKKGQPTYRIIATEKDNARNGSFLEILGYYNPRTEPATIDVKEDRVYEWIRRGAQPSDSVAQLFRRTGTAERILRFKAGEDVAALLSEAAAARTDIDARTNRADAPKAAKKKQEEAAE
jgi:small subunit ribosomal protein S16